MPFLGVPVAVFSWWLWGWKARHGLTHWLLAGPPQGFMWPFPSGVQRPPWGTISGAVRGEQKQQLQGSHSITLGPFYW